MEDAHVRTVNEVLKTLGVSPAKGLSSPDVERLRKQYGRNGEDSLAYMYEYEDMMLTISDSSP